MGQTFFWYDLETSSISPRDGRIMQFAGQRTDMNLEPVGKPVNVLIRLSEDILPDPGAIMVTGITPQSTLQDGITEAEFLKIFYEQVATPDTIFVGYNTVRFDDEFLRFLNYRNYYDAYEWAYKDGKSRWDLLDVVRMTRALRPTGIEWPMTEDGKPTNRLELITKLNSLGHEHAHDALSDVYATIAVAQLIRSKQPKLFEWLLNMRDKKAVKQFLVSNPTCIYSSGKFSNDTEKTSVVRVLHTDDNQDAIVYDLRHDPAEFVDLNVAELVERWRYDAEPSAPARLPVKTMKFNRCPALSPTGILSDESIQQRLKVTPGVVNQHLSVLSSRPDFVTNILNARKLMDEERSAHWSEETPDVDVALYGGSFFTDTDKRLMSVIRAAEPSDFATIAADFNDIRLRELLPRYKARNFADRLTDEERKAWETYRYHTLLDGGDESLLGKYMQQLLTLSTSEGNPEKRYLLEELQLYAESVLPVIYEED